MTRAAFAASLVATLSISAAAYASPTHLDHGFSGDGVKTLHSASHSEILADMAVLPSGKTMVLTLTLDEPAVELWRLRKDGSPDPTYGDHGVFPFLLFGNYEDVHLAVDPWTGKSYVSTFMDGEPFTTTIWRIKANGSLDQAYGVGTGHVQFDQRHVNALLPLSDGRLAMAGSDFAAHTADVWTITSTGGTADWGDPGGRAVLSTNENDDANDLALRSDGKIVVAGSHYSPTDSKLQAYRLTSDGLLDHSFSGNGKATVDPSKTGVTTSTVWTPQVLVRPDNRTVYVGGLNQNNGSFLNSLLVAGLTPKGKPDKVFGKHVYDGLSETWGDAALERDGKLVVAGFVPPNPSTQNAVARFGRKGTLDTSWSGDGILPLNESSDTIALGITPQGRVIVGRTLGSGPYDAELRALRGTRTPSCGGKLATQFGTNKRDTIVGTPRRDVLVGLRGNDKLKGLAGKDVLCGNAGNDTLVGGKGTDVLLGGPGRNTLKP